MRERYRTPLLVDMKIEELKFDGKKYKICLSYNGKLKCTVTKFSLPLPLGLKSISVFQRQFQRIRPHHSSIWIQKNKNLRKKIQNLSFVLRKDKIYDYKIYTTVTTWPQGQYISPNSNLYTAIRIFKQTSQWFSNVSPKKKSWLYFNS